MLDNGHVCPALRDRSQCYPYGCPACPIDASYAGHVKAPGCPACTDVSRLINTGYAGHVILVMTILWFRLDGWPVVCERMRDIVTQRLYDDSALVEK
jgi:hypothetical protein